MIEPDVVLCKKQKARRCRTTWPMMPRFRDDQMEQSGRAVVTAELQVCWGELQTETSFRLQLNTLVSLPSSTFFVSYCHFLNTSAVDLSLFVFASWTVQTWWRWSPARWDCSVGGGSGRRVFKHLLNIHPLTNTLHLILGSVPLWSDVKEAVSLPRNVLLWMCF